MPNIEIYGFDLIGKKESVIKKEGQEAAVYLRSKIEEIMRELTIASDVITTLIPSYTFACKEKRIHTPFLRICSTDAEEIKVIVQALKEGKIGIDIETLILNEFLPADQMK